MQVKETDKQTKKNNRIIEINKTYEYGNEWFDYLFYT